EDEVLASLSPEDAAPQALRVFREDVIREGGLQSPRRLLDLRFQLSGAPPRVAGEDAGSTNPPSGFYLEFPLQESDGPEREHVGAVGLVELGEHDRRLRLYRP